MLYWLCLSSASQCNLTLITLMPFRQLDADIEEDFLGRIEDVFGVERTEAAHLYTLLQQCMDHRQSVSRALTEIGLVWFKTQTASSLSL